MKPENLQPINSRVNVGTERCASLSFPGMLCCYGMHMLPSAVLLRVRNTGKLGKFQPQSSPRKYDEA